jgi:hypothetical protein
VGEVVRKRKERREKRGKKESRRIILALARPPEWLAAKSTCRDNEGTRNIEENR